MSTLSEYFRENRYHFKYHLGDRVRGIWNGIPFTGSVAIDTKVYEDEEPHVLVFSDLPIMLDEITYTLIKCTHDQIESL